ncbi:amino acid adenylation domain-containing protein [Streptomyces zinciresistens K42]|uniref:Amino acid adenylation domain-containing protein n=1 Tax=Streptomyces zinciresistens K42 TaxID=700597 RepID=G2G9E0_9ACTN|nr:non-ribosomal peptide synthetase [Streptomyces zinciresistens]EGX59855.1 amino acid adenylation domain-containing protein [Streptomyces zinciresistens K42]
MSQAPTSRPEDTRERVRTLWRDALGLDGTWSEQATFVELGGYSLLALSLASRIGDALGVEVPRTLILEHQTFAAVTAWLEQPGAGARHPASAPPADAPGPAARQAEAFPMSALQQAYLIGETGGYDLARPAVFCEDYRVTEFDLPRFTAAILTLLRRHEALRLAFRADGTQRVLPPPQQPPLSYRDLRGMADGEAEAALRRSRAELSERVPAADSGTVLWFRVFRLADGHRVQVAGRLLAFDGASGDLLADELRALLAGRRLPPLRYTYRDYQVARAARRASGADADSRQYWLRRLPELPPAPELPRRKGESTAAGMTRRTAVLEPHQWRTFKAGAAAHGVTVTVALCAAFCEILRNYSAAPDFTLNVMYGERQPLHPDVPRVLGNFSDTLLLECRSGADTFAGRAASLGARLAADLAHGAYSGVDGIRELNSRRGAASSPAMPVVFASVIGGGTKDGVFLERLGWRRVGGAIHTPQVSFDHQVFDSDDRLVANWDTVDGIYPPGLVDAMFADYRALLHTLCGTPEAWRSARLVAAPAAQLHVRAGVNDTAVPVPPTTLHEPVFAVADSTPDAPAVIAPDRTLSYGELTDAASTVAHALRAAGCEPGDLVLVQADRGWRQVAALLGVLSTGAAYVPVGPRWPAARIRQVIDRARPRCLLTDDTSGPPAAPDLPRLGLDHVLAGRSAPPGREQPAAPPPPVSPESLAYVIFTSGTTGEPKGVMIRHQSAANTLADLLTRFGIGPDDRVLALSEATFDLSVFDVFGTLAAGGTVVVPRDGAARDPAALHETCAAARVTVWNSVPAHLGMLLDYREAAGRPDLPTLRLAMVSGDWVPVNLGDRLAATLPRVRLVSLGGATEASIWSNWYPVPRPVPAEWTSVPYGHPLANQGFRVLDAHLADRPDWVPGDLYITGRGLADGYLNDPELTKAAFLTHPSDGTRLYRTGDRARYWPDGTLEFLGRRDGQVKVNGMRVELSEVESALLDEPGVRAAAAVVRRDLRGGGLVGHVALDAPGARHPDDLLAALRTRLPDYLVPVSLVVHEHLPLTANGKVDRARMAAHRAEPAAAAVAPAGPAEAALLELWRQLVPVRGVLDDFFASGGHSVSAAVLLNRVEREFGVRLPLATLHRQRTVRDLAAVLARHTASTTVTYMDGAGEPLVLIHPVGGDVLCYRPLVRELAADHAVYAIAADTGTTGEHTVPSMAERYHARIRAELPDRRVRLVGWSYGAAVAYETARLAEGAWPVVMLDPWLPARPGSRPAEAELRRSFARDLSGGQHDDSDDPDGPDLSDTVLTALFDRYRSNAVALSDYRFTPDPKQPVTVVTAEDGFGTARPRHLVPLRCAVDPAALPGARWHTLTGDHFSVVRPARAAEVAALIRRAVHG